MLPYRCRPVLSYTYHSLLSRFNGLSSSKQHNSNQGTHWNIDSSEAWACNCWLWVGMITDSINYSAKLFFCLPLISTFCSCVGPQEVLWARFASKLCRWSSQANVDMHTDTSDWWITYLVVGFAETHWFWSSPVCCNCKPRFYKGNPHFKEKQSTVQ